MGALQQFEDFNKMVSRNTTMQNWVGYLVRVTIKDGRYFIGRLLAFDQYMNLCMAETMEHRVINTVKKGENRHTSQIIKREMGLMLMRGHEIVLFAIEGPRLPNREYNNATNTRTAAGPSSSSATPG